MVITKQETMLRDTTGHTLAQSSEDSHLIVDVFGLGGPEGIWSRGNGLKV